MWQMKSVRELRINAINATFGQTRDCGSASDHGLEPVVVPSERRRPNFERPAPSGVDVARVLLTRATPRLSVPVQPDVIWPRRVSSDSLPAWVAKNARRLYTAGQGWENFAILEWDVSLGGHWLIRGRQIPASRLYVFVPTVVRAPRSEDEVDITLFIPPIGGVESDVGACSDCETEGEKPMIDGCVCSKLCLPGPPCGDFGGCTPCGSGIASGWVVPHYFKELAKTLTVRREPAQLLIGDFLEIARTEWVRR
jgi:hypothetical protein